MKKIDKVLEAIETSVIVVTFIGMIICVTLQICVRYMQLPALYWTEELARYCMIYCVFFAVSSGFKTGAHIGVDALLLALPNRISKWVALFSKCVLLILCILLAKFSFDYVLMSRAGVLLSPTLKFPLYYIYIAISFGFVFSAIRICLNTIEYWNKEIVSNPFKEV